MMMTTALAGLSRTLAAELPSAVPGRAVLIEGWVHRRRPLGAVTFLILRDRSGLAQVVVRDPEALQMVRRCGEESVIAVTGVATPNPAAPGGVEVTEPRITLLGEPALPPPVDVWRPALDAGLPAILDHAAVSWRHPARRARWQLAAVSLRGFRAALDALGFTEIQTPKLVSSATESGATVFGVDQPADPGREHPGGHAVPPGPAPADAVGGERRSRVDAEASGYLVGPPVFKTGERCAVALAGSIPVRLR
jgi:nondiscriminating aspartyl-tRNA synthetase